MALLPIMVVAGEASGDQHASDLVAELRRRRPDLRFFGMGGPKLAAQGVELLYGSHEISVMGFTEVVPKLRRILKVMNGLARAAARRRPGCAILVDIPDFNLKLAGKLKRLGIPVAYYVSPMVWAWRRGRVRQIGDRVDRMLCILPFEERFYRGKGVRAQYVGNPVLEHLPAPAPPESFRQRLGLALDRPTLALLPGSRPGEIRRMLPAMVGAAQRLAGPHPGLQVVVPVAPGLSREAIAEPFSGSGLTVHLVDGGAPEAVGAGDAAVVTSGTATLEAALMGRPMVVVFKLSWTNYWVARALVRVRHIALPNLLVGRRLIPELLQAQMTPERIADALERLWQPGPDRDCLLEGLAEVRAALGPLGATRRAAEAVLTLLPD